MSSPKTHPVKLAPGEFELLEILWNHGPATVTQVHQELLGKGRKVAYPTVQTRLNRLVDKNLLRRDGHYPALYDAAAKRKDVCGPYYDKIESFCGDNIAPLMLHLAEKRDFQPSEIEALKKILEKYEGRNES